MKPGQLVAGKYRLKARLGMGGMGEVWSVLHTGTDREFAIKFMHAHVATSETSRERFAREAKISARIAHPNVIDVFDVGQTDEGGLYLVMELLDGGSLADALYAEPPLTVRDFVAITRDAASALAAAHAVGVVHRDVKPENLFLHRDRKAGTTTVKLLDFGISKYRSAGSDAFTKTSAVLGSPRYMSPEQTRSATAADHRSDIWALGVILFEGLTGTWPHDGDGFSSLVVAVATTPPRSIDAVAPHLPEALRAVVRGCLQTAVDQRFQSATSVVAHLEHALRDPALATARIPRPKGAVAEPSVSHPGSPTGATTSAATTSRPDAPAPLTRPATPLEATAMLLTPPPPPAPMPLPATAPGGAAPWPAAAPPHRAALSPSSASMNVETTGTGPRHVLADVALFAAPPPAARTGRTLAVVAVLAGVLAGAIGVFALFARAAGGGGAAPPTRPAAADTASPSAPAAATSAAPAPTAEPSSSARAASAEPPPTPPTASAEPPATPPTASAEPPATPPTASAEPPAPAASAEPSAPSNIAVPRPAPAPAIAPAKPAKKRIKDLGSGL